MKTFFTGIAIGTVSLFLVSPASAAMTESALLDSSDSSRQQLKIQVPAKQPDIVLVIKQDLDQFLDMVARQNGLSLKISGTLDGTLLNASLPMEIEELLERLATRFDIAWGISGDSLFVSPASLSSEIRMSMPPNVLTVLQTVASRLGPVTRRESLELKEAGEVLIISGPASHVNALTNELNTSGKQ